MLFKDPACLNCRLLALQVPAIYLHSVLSRTEVVGRESSRYALPVERQRCDNTADLAKAAILADEEEATRTILAKEEYCWWVLGGNIAFPSCRSTS